MICKRNLNCIKKEISIFLSLDLNEVKKWLDNEILSPLQNAMLQEMVEEWDQCEKKLKAIQAWITQSRHTLEDSVQKERPLRDQVILFSFKLSTKKVLNAEKGVLNVKQNKRRFLSIPTF